MNNLLDLLDSIIRILFITILAVFLFRLCRGTSDDSDSATGKSNMEVRTDRKTGVQYLASPDGGLTPRLNADGTLAVVLPNAGSEPRA